MIGYCWSIYSNMPYQWISGPRNQLFVTHCWIQIFADRNGRDASWNDVCVKEKHLAKPQWMRWNCGLIMQGYHILMRKMWMESIASQNYRGGFSFLFFDNTRFWKNLFQRFQIWIFATLKVNFRLRFPLYELMLLCANFALLNLFPRNLISSLNWLTCFRIVDDNLKTNTSEQTKNFQAFETHKEGNPKTFGSSYVAQKKPQPITRALFTLLQQ